MDDIEKSLNTTGDQQARPSIFVEEIFLGHYEGDPEGELLKYFLSDDLDEIEKSINRHIINNIPGLREVNWEINTEGLAQKVKDVMSKRDVKYSMTIFSDREDKAISHVVINWHNDDKWLFYGGVIIAKEFFPYDEVGAY